MFLIAITPRAVPDLGAGFQRAETRRDGFVITGAADGRLGRVTETSQGFMIAETVAGSPADPRSRLTLSWAEMNAATGVLRFGKRREAGRPIYYHLAADGGFVCSTHISLLRKAGVPITEDPETVPEYFVYRIATAPRTLYRGIRQLLPGTSMAARIAAGGCVVEQPTQMDFQQSVPDSAPANVDAAAESLYTALDAAIADLACAGERLAVPLSGGMDSSVLYQFCRNRFGTRRSYAAAFAFDDSNEAHYSTTAAAAMQSDHTLRRVAEHEYLRHIIPTIAAAELPTLVEHTAVFNLLFSELPDGQDIVVLGEGADGLFGQKTHVLLSLMDAHPLAMRIMSTPPLLSLLATASRLTGRYGSLIDCIGRSRYRSMPLSSPDHWIWSMGLMGSTDWVSRYFGVSREALIRNRLESLAPYADRSDYDLISLMGWLTDGSVLQDLWSKVAEANGRTAYYPFSGDPIVRAAASLSWPHKLSEPKALLAVVARRIGVPEFILTRPKSGFGIRRRDWALPGGLFEPLIPLAAKVFPERELRGMQSRDLDKRFTFWNMLNYALWKRVCIDGENTDSLSHEFAERIDSSNRVKSSTTL